MSPIELVLWILTPLVVIIQFYNHWCYSKGKLNLAYPLSMLAYSIYTIIETIIALRDPSQLSIMLFNLVNIWGFLMAFRGYMRLKKENKNI